MCCGLPDFCKNEGCSTNSFTPRICSTPRGWFLAIQGLPNSPASVASRYFLAPQAKILRFSRPRWSISRQNEAPWSSTGRTKVVRNFELSTKMLLAHALLAGKALGPHQGFYLPYLAAYVQGGISCRGGAFRTRSSPAEAQPRVSRKANTERIYEGLN